MKYKILIPNAENGLFYFTKERLEEFIDEIYNEGYEEGKKAGNLVYVPYPQTSSPSVPYDPNPKITWLGPNDVPPNLYNDVKYSTDTITSKG